MADGAFEIGDDPADPREIAINIRSGITDIPVDQQAFWADISQTWEQLDRLYPAEQPQFGKKFETARLELRRLAEVGLGMQNVQTALAKRGLEKLRIDVQGREGPRIKNAYMCRLGRWAIGGAGIGFLVWWMARRAERKPLEDKDAEVWASFALLWIGCMVGVWLSFGARKTIIRFEDLTQVEADWMAPALRLVFAGLLTLLIGALFHQRAVVINVGAVSTDSFASNPVLALLIGALCGLSELLLPARVSKQAENFLKLG